MTEAAVQSDTPLPKARLWTEFLALFVLGPLVLAFKLPPSAMFTVLGLVTLAGWVLLHRTPGFHWRELLAGPVPWRPILILSVATFAFSAAAVQALFPGMLFRLATTQVELWMTIMLAYPLVSALPQEVVFRPLFFRRYGSLFPSTDMAIWANAFLFALAHLMYGHPVVLLMTFVGGWVFAWLYVRRGSFLGAVIAHGVAGNIIFTTGLGILFYSGAVN